MIHLTESAIKAVSRFIDHSETPAGGLRIRVSDGGCSGLKYGMELEEREAAEDTVLECGQVKIFIDSGSLAFVRGMTVDFIDSIEGSGFQFTNPNAAKSCACGSSFSTC